MTETDSLLMEYRARGWQAVPIEPGTKAPRLKGWPDLRADLWEQEHGDGTWGQVFEGKGIGLLLGPASGGLVDVDFDCLEAATLARAALPPTLGSGRSGSRGSHRWYVLNVDDAAEVGMSTTRWVDPVAMARDGGEVSERTVLLEVRWEGAQTIVAPTLHPSGEAIEWEGELDDVRRVGAADLLENTNLIAAASILARYWPGKGSRHDAALALCGALARGNITYWRGDLPGPKGPVRGTGNPLRAFLNAVCFVAGDDEVEDRLASVATTLRAIERHGDEARVQGWPTLAEVFKRRGAEEAVWKAKEWIEQALVTYVEDEVEQGEASDEGVDEVTTVESTDEDGDVEIGRLDPVDLVKALAEGVPPIEWVMDRLLIKGQVHTFVGYTGVGKSLATMWVIDEILRDPRATVMYIDEENGLDMTLRRIESLDVAPSRLRRLFYYPFPGLNLRSERDYDALLKEVNRVNPVLLVVDSMVDLLSAAHLSQNDNDEVAMFYKRVIEPLRIDGRTVLLHDHLAKHDPSHTKGAGAKDELVQIVWSLSQPSKFSGDTAGILQFTRRKDRTGALPESEQVFVVPQGNGRTQMYRHVV